MIIRNLVIEVAFKICAPFTTIDETTIDDTENLDSVMPMHNLIEYSPNYSETRGRLWLYSKDEGIIFNNNNANIDKFKYINYKAELLENTETDGDHGILENATITVTLKYLGNFWRSLEMLLINLEVELKLKWTKYCVLLQNTNANPNNIIFTIKDTKLYVSGVTLSARETKNYQTPLAKDLKNYFIGINIRQKVRIKVQQINLDILSDQILLESINSLF